MDLSNLAPDLGKLFGVQPSTLVLLLVIINTGARNAARAIPNDSVGFWGFMRQLLAIIGTEVSSKVTSGVTVADAAKAVAENPALAAQIAAAKDDKPAA